MLRSRRFFAWCRGIIFKLLDAVLRRYGLALVSMCCCGSAAVKFEEIKAAEDWTAAFETIRTKASQIETQDPFARLDRSKKKFARNKEFLNS